MGSNWKRHISAVTQASLLILLISAFVGLLLPGKFNLKGAEPSVELSKKNMSLSSTACDVIFQVFDGVLLFSNNCLYDVANRNDSDQLFVLQHGKMPYALVCKQSHTFFNVFFWTNEIHMRAHDFPGLKFS